MQSVKFNTESDLTENILKQTNVQHQLSLITTTIADANNGHLCVKIDIGTNFVADEIIGYIVANLHKVNTNYVRSYNDGVLREEFNDIKLCTDKRLVCLPTSPGDFPAGIQNMIDIHKKADSVVINIYPARMNGTRTITIQTNKDELADLLKKINTN